jgi:quercetin dioxygenase-like cupin family protein
MRMKALIPTILAFSFATVHGGWAQQGIKSTPVFKSSTTAAGQPIQFPKTEKPEIAANLVEIAPGGESGWHKHPAPLYLHILEGELTLYLEGQEKPLVFGPGSGSIEPVDLWHNGKNLGSVPLRFLAVYVKDADTPGLILKNPPKK